jgi:hypothetical protein
MIAPAISFALLHMPLQCQRLLRADCRDFHLFAFMACSVDCCLPVLLGGHAFD